jgi:PAS domain S-box-containing protein
VPAKRRSLQPSTTSRARKHLGGRDTRQNGSIAIPVDLLESLVDELEASRRELSTATRERATMVAAVETAVDAIITINQQGLIQTANAAVERMFGYSQPELIGKNVRMLMPEPYAGEHDRYLRNYLTTGRARIIGIGREVTAKRKDGTTFPMSLSVSEVILDGRRVFTGIIHDLTSRRQLERQIVEASAHEQRRIGQDLHDGLCQDLIGIAFATDNVARQLRAGTRPDPAQIEQIASSVREAALQARRLSHGLNPVDPKAGGLPIALDRLAHRIAETFRLSCTFHWDGKARPREDSSATHLYRIAQEAVSNAIRHGKATKIDIRLTCGKGGLVLRIQDNGVGLPDSMVHPALADSIPIAASGTGIGLHGMKYRTHIIGGMFDIRPGPKRGTLVECLIVTSLPWMAGDTDEAPEEKPPQRVGKSGKSRASNRRPSR